MASHEETPGEGPHGDVTGVTSYSDAVGGVTAMIQGGYDKSQVIGAVRLVSHLFGRDATEVVIDATKFVKDTKRKPKNRA